MKFFVNIESENELLFDPLVLISTVCRCVVMDT